MSCNSGLKCPVCGFKQDLEGNIKQVRHYSQWDLYSCIKCSFEFWWPMQQANHRWWEDSYDTYKSLDTKPYLESRHKNLLVNLPLKAGRVLDIGCGEGVFLNEMNKRGFDVYGIDLNKWAIEKAKKLFGLRNLQPISVYDLVDKEHQFELITFFEILEHIGNPKEFIEIVKELLNKNGFISFSVPDVKMYGLFEESQNVPPYHFNRYNAVVLKKFLENNGFKVILFRKINRLDSLCFLNNILIKLFGKHPSSGKLNKCILVLWKCLSFPWREFLYILGFRSTFFVIAQLKK